MTGESPIKAPQIALATMAATHWRPWQHTWRNLARLALPARGGGAGFLTEPIGFAASVCSPDAIKLHPRRTRLTSHLTRLALCYALAAPASPHVWHCSIHTIVAQLRICHKHGHEELIFTSSFTSHPPSDASCDAVWVARLNGWRAGEKHT